MEEGTLIGNLSTIDDNNSIFEYSFVNESFDSIYFRIDGDKLLTNTVLNIEITNEYYITIETKNESGYNLLKIFTIYVLNSDKPPILSLLENNTIYENLPIWTLVGEIETIDNNSTNFSYKFIDSQTVQINTLSGET